MNPKGAIKYTQTLGADLITALNSEGWRLRLSLPDELSSGDEYSAKRGNENSLVDAVAANAGTRPGIG
ncbi:hypothetical protein, partial [Ensifer sp. 4252]|uniref:hypothetical protein n=1 Tax=Ensifer sp. 4252 TaxID=3373915 RepID=UPI003D223008